MSDTKKNESAFDAAYAAATSTAQELQVWVSPSVLESIVDAAIAAFRHRLAQQEEETR